jgi:hypothetical protein
MVNHNNSIQRILIVFFFVLICGSIVADRLGLPDFVSTVCMLLAVIALVGYLALKYRQRSLKENYGDADNQTPVVLVMNTSFKSATEAELHMKAATSAEYTLHKTLIDQNDLRASAHWTKGRLGNSLFLIEIHTSQLKKGAYETVVEEFRSYVTTEWSGEPILGKVLEPFRAHLVNVIAFVGSDTDSCSELMNVELADKEFLILSSWICLADGKLHLLWPTGLAYPTPYGVPGSADGSIEILQERLVKILNYGRQTDEKLNISFRDKSEDDYDGPRL